MKKNVLYFILVCCFLAAAPSVMAQHYKYSFQNPKLPDEVRLNNVLSLMTLDEKINMFGGAGIERLGVRSPGSSECIHGIVLGGAAWNRNKPQQVTTCYPQGYGLGETWDVDLHHRVAQQIAYEARFLYQNPKYLKNCLILWSPNADMGRDIRWGRTEECYGEDPFLTGEMVTAFVKGLQGNNPRYWTTASLMKHFLANSNENGRGHTSSNFDEALFREYYAYSFGRGIVKGGANALMTAYNKYNGIPCTVNPILRNVLMKEWGFNGIITTDGGAFKQLKNAHKYYDSLDKAAQGCIEAGTTRFLDDYKQALKDALNEKLVTEKQLDANIKGNLRVMLRLGLLDSSDKNPYRNIGITDTIAPWTKQETKDLVRLVADKSVVLLKNENNLLPLDASKIHKIAVIGNRCDSVYGDWYGGAMSYRISPLKAIKELADAHQIEVRYVRDDKEGAAQNAAAWADVAIVCVGNDPVCSPEWGTSPWGHGVVAGEGREDVDRASIQLEQEDLVKLVRKVNPHTVLVLISSFPYAINWSEEHVPAIIHLTQSCQEMGHAATDVLFGSYNPAGRTTQTWVTSIDELPNMLDYNIRHGRTYMYYKGRPLYPFGYGLSYTQFKYSNIGFDRSTVAKGKSLTVTADISNVGQRDGEEVVQLYVTLPGDSAACRLKGFKRIAIRKGETQKVSISVPAEDLMLWNIGKHAFELPQGEMKVMLGASSADIRLSGAVALK
jgi:beta-glucosidase